ncbi:MucR family transcriptional regulator [Micromonospora sp. STR1s_5]|nr:MucR family transcriptional regulator [Micromonospora sp. STR1s_5]
MDQQSDPSNVAVTELTAEIVSAYVGHNSVHLSDLPKVIASIHSALENLRHPREPVQAKPMPRMSLKKTVTPDFLISLEDGKPYKSLKRHLARRGLSPEQYRAKWGLPPDYPMVAASYSAQRSEMARALGLGRKREKPALAKRARRRKAA